DRGHSRKRRSSIGRAQSHQARFLSGHCRSLSRALPAHHQKHCYIFPLSSLHILLCARAASGHATAAQQFPPSNGDCHTPLPCEVRKGNDTTPPVCSLHVRGGRMLVAVARLRGRKRKGSVFRFAPESGHRNGKAQENGD